jgi:hypothetical protein
MGRSGDQASGRRWLTLAAATVTLAACGSAAGSGTNLTMWLITTGPSPANTVINQAVSSFEKSHPGDTITVDYVENQSYKQNIQLAIGAGNAPTIFWTSAAARSSSTSGPVPGQQRDHHRGLRRAHAVMVSFVRDIPRELIGAMLVDGGTEWTVFRRLIVPLSKPVLATLAIYDGLNVWNNFILPLVLTQSNNVAVLPLGLTKLEGQYAINVPAVMAAVLLSSCRW